MIAIILHDMFNCDMTAVRGLYVMGKEEGVIVILLTVLPINQYSFSNTVSNRSHFEVKHGL
jgi:hypothetical protein